MGILIFRKSVTTPSAWMAHSFPPATTSPVPRQDSPITTWHRLPSINPLNTISQVEVLKTGQHTNNTYESPKYGTVLYSVFPYLLAALVILIIMAIIFAFFCGYTRKQSQKVLCSRCKATVRKAVSYQPPEIELTDLPIS